MTTTPLTPERLREIAALATGYRGAWWREDVVEAIPELLAEITRLNALCTDSAQSYCRALDRQRAELDAAQAEVARLNGAVLRLANNERDLAETNLLLEQQDRDLGRQRVHIAALESGHAEMRRGCEEWRAGCDERDARIDALEAEVLRLTETARAASENWMAACKQRDEARASHQWEMMQRAACRTRIAALETALREACGYIDPAYCDDGTTTPTKDRLLTVADGVESRKT